MMHGYDKNRVNRVSINDQGSYPPPRTAQQHPRTDVPPWQTWVIKPAASDGSPDSRGSLIALHRHRVTALLRSPPLTDSRSIKINNSSEALEPQFRVSCHFSFCTVFGGESFFIFYHGNAMGRNQEDWGVKGDEALLCERMHGDDYDGLVWDFAEITFPYSCKRFQFVNIMCGFHNEDLELERCPFTRSVPVGPLLLILIAALVLLNRIFGKNCTNLGCFYLWMIIWKFKKRKTSHQNFLFFL